MKKIAIALFSMVAMAGVASAQPAVKADTKAGAAVNAKVDAKAATPAAAAKVDTKAAASAAMEMPKPPAEIATTLKSMGAKQSCTGTAMGGADGKTEMKFKGTMTHKSDLDGWWIHDSFNGTMGEGKAAMKFKMESYMTYDSKMGKWRTTSVMNDGGNSAGTTEMKDGKIESQSDAWGMMGAGKLREHGDMTDKKAGMHMWGEMSMDAGKTWNKIYDLTCK